MNYINYYFGVMHLGASIFTLIMLLKLNQGEKDADKKITLADCLQFILMVGLSFWLLTYHIKTYLIIGTLLSIIAGITFTLSSTSEEIEEVPLTTSLWVCFCCFVFWSQVIGLNYLVVKRKGLGI
jgi:hypothetical protein